MLLYLCILFTGEESSTGISRSETTEGEDNSWGLHRCPQCPYTTTHKLSLNGHMNMHTTASEESTSITSPKAKPSASTDARAADRYCTDCDIQFSSLKTFRVHKAHYCQTRHVHKASKSPVVEESSHSSSLIGNNSPGQPILLLPTDPVLLVPYSILVGASLLPSHVLPQQSPAVLTPDGQIQPLSAAHALASQQLNSTSVSVSPGLNSASRAKSNPSATASPQVSPQSAGNLDVTANEKIIKEEPQTVSSEVPSTAIKRRGDGECPLDLTTKRSKLSIKADLMSDEEKENREVNTPSLSNSPAVARNGSMASSVSGEFEGKLLSSPPCASPSVDMGERSSIRSPRPASAAPSLSSPRAMSQESPRASTSGANRSPTQTSPTLPQTVLPQLPAGFPNLLAGLDSINSSPFASLQYLQSLQSASSDILLKMFNGIVPPTPLPSSTPVKQGEARCNECNITFFKEENYLVHKKHYCAARDRSHDDDRQSTSQTSPPIGASRGSLSPQSRNIKTELPNVSNISIRDISKTPKPSAQYVCSPCNIKFTSPDNLAAHQTYYCPKREGSTSEEGVTKGMWRCPRCRVAMPETLQAAHQCVNSGSSTAHGWKCPCCPVLSPTAATAQKHLETHAGIKAFRCTLCGYRGNTLRGMRTHIRMHFEKRTNDLQEENFIECILEDSERHFRRSNEHQQVLLENPALAAAILSKTSNNMVDSADPPLSCTICSYVTTQRAAFIKHLASAHKLGVELKNFLESQAAFSNLNEKQETSDSGNGATGINSPPLAAVKLEPEVKLEVNDSEEESHLLSKQGSNSEEGKSSRNTSPPARLSSPSISALIAASKPSTSSSRSIEGVHHCHACNISFSMIESYRAHRQFYCSRQQSNTPPETTVQ